MRRCILALLALVGSCSALMVGSAPSHAMRVAVSPMMKGRMGSANGGGDPAKSDKKSRGLIRRLITVSDSAENVNAILLSSQTEHKVIKMNWKVRRMTRRRIEERAKEFGVEIPDGWGAFDVKNENTLQYKLKALSAHPYSSPRSEIAAVELNKLKHF